MTKEETAEEKRRVGNEVMERVIQAMDSFYPTPDKAMVWLLKFLQTDLSKLGPTNFDPLRYELASFVWHGPPELPRINLAVAKPWQTHVYDRLSIPSLKEAAAVQTYVRNLLDEFMQEGKLSYRIPAMTKFIARVPRFVKAGKHSHIDPTLPDTFWMASSVRDALIYYFDRLLDRFALNLYRCPSHDRYGNVCRKIFLSSRHDQKYCSKRCENRINARRYRLVKKAKKHKAEKKKGTHERKGVHRGTKRRY